MLRRLGPRRDGGAGAAEYAGLVVLAALILGALWAAGIPSKVEPKVSAAVCQILGGSNCTKHEASGRHNDHPGQTGDPNGQTGEPNGDGDDQGQGGDEPDLGDLQDQVDQAQNNLGGLGDGSNIKQQIIDLLKDFVGITDVEKCLTEGDIASCLWAVLDVGSLFFAALKIAKFAKAIKSAIKLWKDFNRIRKAVERAKTALKTAKDRLKLARAACGLRPNSFIAGTPVLMASGRYRPIEDVRVGDRVLAAAPGAGQARPEPVRGVIRAHHRERVVRLGVATDPLGLNTATLAVTAGHPVWSRTRGTWVDADGLRPGERLAAPGGGTPRVVRSQSVTATRTFYNLTVAGVHTYFVRAGDSALLVHNVKRCNLPSYKKVKIDMAHIKDRHTPAGKTAKQSGKKDLFPESMTDSQIQKTVKEAYRNGKRVGSQPPDRVQVRGEYDGVKVEMWVNVRTKQIETAYPVK